jgi:5-(carboxyamino)imidazole ribonucleotide mutase
MKGYNSLKNIKIVFITIAGRSNALSGVVACNTEYPVLACPPFKDKIDMFININSTLQCPSNTPVLAVLEPENVAISCKRILSL